MKVQLNHDPSSGSPGEEFLKGSFGSGNASDPEKELHDTGKHTEGQNNTESGATDSNKDNSGAKPSEEAKEDSQNKEQPKKEEASIGSFVSGELGVEIMDAVIPKVIVWTGKKTGFEIDRKDYELTAKEKSTLSPPMQRFLDYVKLDLSNPVHGFLIAVGLIYGAKFAEKGDNIKRIKKAKVIKTEFTKSPTPNINPEASIDEPIENEYEKMKAEKQERFDSMSKEEKKYYKLVKDTREARKQSYDKAVEFLKRNNKLPKDYIFPGI